MGLFGDRLDDGDRRGRGLRWEVGSLRRLSLLLIVVLASCGPSSQPGQRPNQFPPDPSAAGEELVRSAENEDWERFAELLDAGVSIDSVNRMGQTSLQFLAANGRRRRVACRESEFLIGRASHSLQTSS